MKFHFIDSQALYATACKTVLDGNEPACNTDWVKIVRHIACALPPNAPCEFFMLLMTCGLDCTLDEDEIHRLFHEAVAEIN